MKLPRRAVLRLTVGAVVLPAASRIARAQTYPARPVHVVVGFTAGSGPDVIARLVGQRLSERLGQQFVVENRPGAGSSIAAQNVVNAPADGYMVLLAAAANTINASLYQNLNFNFVRDVAPVALIVAAPFVMIVSPAFPAKTIPEFIAYAKANPGKINMASPGIGTTPHLMYELFKMKTGVDLVHVPYRTSYIPDLLGGQVQVALSTVIQSLEFIRDGKLRALAVTSATRVAALPEVPAVGEFVPGYDASGWFGICAPRTTPAAIIDTLNSEINAIVAEPDIKARLVALGNTPRAMTPAEFGKLIADDTDKWAKVIKAADIKPE